MAGVIVEARRGINRALSPIGAGWTYLTRIRGVRPALLALALVAALVFPHVISSGTQLNAAVQAEVFVLLALGLNIVVGYAGLLDLGYAAFFAIGAYVAAFLGSPHFAVTGHGFTSPILSFGPHGIYVNFYLLIPICAVAAAVCGVIFGAPTLRLRGDYLAIVTLGFGEIVPQVIQNLGPGNSLGLPDITGGVNAIVGIESPPPVNLFGVHASFTGTSLRPWYYLGLAIVVASIIIIRSLRGSRLGRAWQAIREDEIAAAHMGINITRTRLMAFGLGAAFSGFGGLLNATQLGSAYYTSFGFSVSITILVMVILGGVGSIPGVIIGAILLSYLNLLWLGNLSTGINNLGTSLHHAPGLIGALGAWMASLNLASASPLLLGIILLLMMLLRPQGIWPSSTRARELQPATEQVLDEENTELYTVRTE